MEAVEREHPRDVVQRSTEKRGQHCRGTPHGSWKNEEAQKGAVDEPAGARDAEVDAGLAALDEQSRELHAIALEMCNGVAQKTVRCTSTRGGGSADGVAC